MAWILERNLGAWCDAVSVLLGDGLPDAEWADIRRGVSSASFAIPFHYRLGGRDGVDVTCTLDDPPDVAHVFVGPTPLEKVIEGITTMCRYFRIEGRVRRFDKNVDTLSPGWVIVKADDGEG